MNRQEVLSQLIHKHQWTYGAELGVWQAQLLAPILKNFPRLRMVGVDRWLPLGAYAAKDMKHARTIARKALEPVAHRVTILEEETVTAAARFAPSTFDFVFIDASHDTDSVRADIQAWCRKVKDTGALTGHDANLASVRAALDELLPGWVELEAHVWVWPAVKG